MVMLALGLAAGCNSGTIGDTPAPDAPVSPPVVDAAGPADAPVADAPVADAPVADAPVADAPPPPTCNELYGAVPEYLLCQENDTTCMFNARTNGGNCNEMCSQFGGTCVAAFDNVSDPGAECSPVAGSTDDCTTLRSTEICLCSRE